MELVFPWVLYIGIPIVLILPFLRFKHNTAYKEGKKVANTSFIEETQYYKKLIGKYKVLCTIALTGLLFTIAAGVVMISRPAEVKTNNSEIHNRDIFLCMDISDSVDELNLEICDELKKVVKELDGERFGITIFNGQSVLLVPLTTDYDYVLETLDNLEKSFEASLSLYSEDFGMFDYANFDFSAYQYKYQGTLSDYGSSFIGDGLASCLYNFSDLKENSERSRLIIFTTDNELNGTPFVTLEEAAGLCKKNDVKVFAIAPDNIVDEAVFKGAIEDTGGGYYKVSSDNAIDNLIEDIRKVETSVLEKQETIFTDKPEIIFVCMVIFIGIYFIFSRKVKL